MLSEFSFRLAPGKVLGVVGRTGSGKTTIARLILRLYDQNSGLINVGGHDLRQLSLESLRGRVGLVTQEVQLFEGTVRDNLTLFDKGLPDQRIHETIKLLGLSRWYAGLTEGLDAVLQTDGRGLSAGEGQLLAFARVFLRDPGLVILDEATSRLDPATQSQIEGATDRLLADRTAVLIAHRLETLD